MVNNEELIRRAELIQNDKKVLDSLRQERSIVFSKVCNLKSDVLTFPENYRFRTQLEELRKKVNELDEKIRFYVIDVHKAEQTLKHDKKMYSTQNKPITIHNKELKKYAINDRKPYTDKEIEYIFKNTEAPWNQFPNDEITNIAIMFKRTFKAIQAIVRVKQVYLETGELRDFYFDWSKEEWTKSMQQMKKILYKLYH